MENTFIRLSKTNTNICISVWIQDLHVYIRILNYIRMMPANSLLLWGTRFKMHLGMNDYTLKMNSLFMYVFIQSYLSIYRHENIYLFIVVFIHWFICLFMHLSAVCFSFPWGSKSIYLPHSFHLSGIYLSGTRKTLFSPLNSISIRQAQKIEIGSFISMRSSISMFFRTKGLAGLIKMDDMEKNSFTKRNKLRWYPQQQDHTLETVLLRNLYGWRPQIYCYCGRKDPFSRWIFSPSFPDCLTPSSTIFTSWTGPCWAWGSLGCSCGDPA